MSQEGGGKGVVVFIIIKTSKKAGQMNLKGKKSINLLISSSANMFLLLHSTSCRSGEMLRTACSPTLRRTG